MEKILIIFITILIFSLQVSAEKITVDSKGNVYLLGSFQDSIKFSDSTVIFTNNPYGNPKTYLVKLDPNGSVLWYKLFDQREENNFDIHVDHTDHLVLASLVLGSIALDSVTIIQDVFRYLIARFDTDGNLLWYNLSSKDANSYGVTMAIDGQNNIYTSGLFASNFNFHGPDTIFTVYPTYKPFIAKFDSSGYNSWLQKLDNWTFRVFDIDVDDLGNLVMVGGLQDSIILQGDTLYAMAESDGYWAKFDTHGDLLKFKQIHGSVGAGIFDVGAGKNGHFSYVGFFRGDTLYIDDFPPTLPTTSESGNFVAHVDNTDTEMWLLNFNGTFDSDHYGIEMDSTNNTYLYTLWEQGYYFNSSLNSFVGADLSESKYMIKMDSAGNFLCFLKINNGQIKDIEIRENGQIYLVANFEDFLTLNGTTYTQPGNSIFIATFDLNCNAVWTSLISNPVVGINEASNSGNNNSIYPNPASHTITISLRDYPVKSEKITLFTMEGNRAMELKFSGSEQIELDIDKLSPGIYIIQVLTSDHKKLNYRMVKI
ncbi:MAG: T9SS type A sorting domain-containing protein [Saprospiraceae bacterium]